MAKVLWLILLEEKIKVMAQLLRKKLGPKTLQIEVQYPTLTTTTSSRKGKKNTLNTTSSPPTS
jgi:homoserine trans-succinylase